MESRLTYSINELKYLHEDFSYYQMTNGESFIPLNCSCKNKYVIDPITSPNCHVLFILGIHILQLNHF